MNIRAFDSRGLFADTVVEIFITRVAPDRKPFFNGLDIDGFYRTVINFNQPLDIPFFTVRATDSDVKVRYKPDYRATQHVTIKLTPIVDMLPLVYISDINLIVPTTIVEPSHEKTNNLGCRPGPTQTRLYSHRIWLEAGNFRFRKKRNCTILVVKTKALICSYM